MRSIPMTEVPAVPGSLASPIPVRRRLLYGVIVALGLFALIEGAGWAIWGPPPPPQALIRVTASSIVLKGDEAVLSHLSTPRQNVAVPLNPPHGKPRVIFLGESSVRHSYMSPPAVNFPYHVQRQLPGMDVVNFGTPGQSASGIVRLSSQLAPLQPDLVVVYTGHNEFNQPIFEGDVGGVRLWMLPAYQALGLSWTRAGLSRMMRSRPWGRRDDRPPHLLDPNRRARLIPTVDDRLLESQDDILTRFYNELHMAVKASPAPVVLATLLRNFDQAPTGVLTAGRPGCWEAVKDAPTLRPQDPERWAEVSARACGEEAALTQFYRAHAARKAGRSREAREAWRRSLASDPLPLRAPLEADAVIRRVADETGTALVDLAERIGPFADASLFDDMLHPSPNGASRIADVLSQHLRDTLEPVSRAD